MSHLIMYDPDRKGACSIAFSDVLFYLHLTIAKFTMCLKCCSSARRPGRGRSKVGSYHTGSGKTGRKEEKSHNSCLGTKLPVTFLAYKSAAELCKT